jgi:hypothetical protein
MPFHLGCDLPMGLISGWAGVFVDSAARCAQWHDMQCRCACRWRSGRMAGGCGYEPDLDVLIWLMLITALIALF